MSWFLVAIISPVLYAMSNHIDKILLGKYFKEGGVGTLMIYSSLLSVLILPVILFIDPTVLQVDLFHIAILSLVGFIYTLLLWLYLKALEEEEASVTIVFYQLVPVFGFILGYFILGEVLTTMQLIAMATVIFGTTIIAFEIDTDNKLIFRRRTVLYMLGASLCWALGSVIFKAVALEETVIRSLFWENFALVIIGICFFTLVPTYRTHFLISWRENSKSIIALNVTNEVLYIVANAVVSFAYLMAPIALVLLTQSFQPIFVLTIGIILTLLFPQLVNEKMGMKHLVQRIIAIIITGIGTYLLLM